jgi:K+-sensing histidine kinase KdpD
MNLGGIGLGLVISNLIVTKFGGSLNFTSEENVGSSFIYSFEMEEMETKLSSKEDKYEAEDTEEAENDTDDKE